MDIRLPARNNRGHKGTFGTVAIVGGSISSRSVMLGSPVFAAQAAIRSGAGLITFVGPKELLTHLIRLVPQAVGVIPSDGFSDISGKWQSIVIGPGLGVNRDNIKLMKKVLALNKPTVIDADALNTLAKYPELFKLIHDKCVLTPHPKEFQRLAEAVSVKDAGNLVERLGCTLILKSHNTEIYSPGEKWVEKGENPALATGGTGDVLAGLVGGLMAQYYPNQLSVFDCACTAVAIHSKAAKQWRKEYGSAGLLINELLDFVPGVMQKMRPS
ncbi:MAG TPA: NAD(P)H-hydrate dehydratase [Candidatus Saccharimonadales bacterium]|nr:NAD(P)H-hydrate dehydratase [Candidatus Saccharimonadales bacterium]